LIERLIRYAGLLREPAFRRLWVAQSISQVGTQVTWLALPLVAILVLGASPFEVALLGAVDFLPFLLFTLAAGAWVDRLPKQRVMVAADLGRMAVLSAIPAAALLHVLGLWQLYLAQVLGPGLAGVLVGAITAPIAILLDAVSYLASAAFLFGLRPRFAVAPRAPTDASGKRSPSILREVLEGLRFYRASPLLRATSVAIASLNLGGQIGGSIFLVYLVRELALAPETLGLALSIGSLGLLAGAATASGFGKRVGVGPTLIIASVLSAGASLLMVVASEDTAFWLLALSGLIQGYAVMLINVNGVSLRQALTPDQLQGRVNATGRWINWSVIPPGALLGGAIATAVGLRMTIAIGGLVGLIAVPWLLVSPLRRVRELPHPYGEPPEVMIST
jgi:MFS family permease